MLTVAAMGYLAYAGWARKTWWRPLQVYGLALPFMLMQIGAINSWRKEARVGTYDGFDIAFNLVLTLGLYLAAFVIGRVISGLRRRNAAIPSG